MTRCAERWKELLLSSGADRADIFSTSFNPVVYGEKIVDPSYKTVLVYGHYDVMPVEPLELWHSDPFEPIIKEGRIWARGADDDKGQAMIQAKAFEYAVTNNLLKCNVKFLLEGGEEVGSPGVEEFCMNNKELLKADIILVSDTSMLDANLPSITTGLRGLAYWEIEVTGPNRDLHSGIFGGAVANPINELCKIIADLKNSDGEITIPDFYQDVEILSAEEKMMMDQIPFSEEEYKKSLGVNELFGESGYSTLERTSVRPTFDVCGIWGGYTGEGTKTVLPSKAFAKVSCRLVPQQDYKIIEQQLIDHIQQTAPSYVDVKVKALHGGESYVCPIDLPEYMVAEEAYTKAFGCRPLAVRRGGSIPIISTFERILGVKSILMGFGLESNATHSPNENFSIDLFKKGIETVATFYSLYS
ncbi:dipeptidase [Porphyromonadaceae bacterium]